MKLVEQIDTTLGELTLHGAERRLEALKDINRQNKALIKTVVEFAKLEKEYLEKEKQNMLAKNLSKNR